MARRAGILINIRWVPFVIRVCNGSPRLRPREGPDLDAHAAGQEAESFSIPGMFALTLNTQAHLGPVHEAGGLDPDSVYRMLAVDSDMKVAVTVCIHHFTPFFETLCYTVGYCTPCTPVSLLITSAFLLVFPSL